MMKPKKLKGLATGIGSLPHKDAQQALDLIFRYTPQVPFWPQLPKRDIREGMVAQFSEGLPCIKAGEKGLIFDPKNKEKELEGFYEKIINKNIEDFAISENFAVGLSALKRRLGKEDKEKIKFIKCQVTGPFTFAASINDEKNVALLHDKVFMQAILNCLTMKAIWQLRYFKEFGKKMILFLDEPYLGCFGSAFTPINRQDVINGLSELAQNIKKSEDVLLGIHCCGNTDWSIFTDTPDIDIISFDAFSFLDKLLLYAEHLKKFLKDGKVLCWGIVPTQEFSLKENAQNLSARIKEGIAGFAKKEIDKELLLEALMLSPSCGLGTLDPEKSELIFKLLSETALKIIKE